METDKRSQHATATAIVRRMAVKTGALIALAALGVAAFSSTGGSEVWWFIPASILFGGAMGVLNFHWLAQTVERIYIRPGMARSAAQIAGMVLTALKLSAIFLLLFIVIKWQLLHLFGLVAGLSLSFVAILWEGFLIMLGMRRT